MKIKTSELTGAALDWAVAKCEGREDTFGWKVGMKFAYYPSRKWVHGGPIIERELICIDAGDGSYEPLRKWAAWHAGDVPLKAPHEFHGLTPLIAAMRCFVASRLGDEVDVPEEL